MCVAESPRPMPVIHLEVGQQAVRSRVSPSNASHPQGVQATSGGRRLQNLPPDVIAVPLRPRPEAWMTGQLRGHMDLGPFPTGLAPESLVLYTQALGIPTGYLQISPQRRDQLPHQFRCQARSERETFSSFHLPDAAVPKRPALQVLAPNGLSQKATGTVRLKPAAALVYRGKHPEGLEF